jgi:hypothetical protein
MDGGLTENIDPVDLVNLNLTVFANLGCKVRQAFEVSGEMVRKLYAWDLE